GRLVQVHNLPRNYLGTLDTARNLVKTQNTEAVKLLYGNVPDTLSQLIRTAFVPSPGNIFLVADFSAIEARVIAWLAGEAWRQEVFATHGKIYEASAASMFGVPVEKIKKGNPEYALRQKGKIAELALGYGGSSGALIQMGALKMGLTEDELPEIVHRWRKANKRIIDLWYGLENAALLTMRTGRQSACKNIMFARETDYKHDFLTVKLPGGRKLYYVSPFLAPNRWGNESVHYYGLNKKNNWGILDTYGGKLTENIVQAIARDCLAISIQNLEAEGYKIVMHVHDEVIIDHPLNCDPESALKDVCDIMGKSITWAPGLLLKAEGFSHQYYKKE
ncbi:MAG: DNA polymerase, partial [Clostridiales bacterium]